MIITDSEGGGSSATLIPDLAPFETVLTPRRQYRSDGEGNKEYEVAFDWEVADKEWNTEVQIKEADGTVARTLRYLRDDEQKTIQKVWQPNATLHPTVYETDARGYLTKVTYHSNMEATGLYVDGAEQKSPAVTMTYAYNAFRELVSTTVDPGGPNEATVRLDYDSYGQPVKITDAAGRVTRYEYCDSAGDGCDSASGALKRVKVEGTGGSSGAQVTRLFSNKHGQINQALEADGTLHQQTFDSLGYPDKEYQDKNGINLVSDSDYNKLGYLTRHTDPLGVRTDFQFNRMGWLTRRTVDVGGENIRTDMSYNPQGLVTRVTEDVGGKNRHTDYRYRIVGTTNEYGVDLLTEASGTAEERNTLTSYHVTGEVASQQLSDKDGNTLAPVTFDYDYDQFGALKVTTDLPGVAGKRTARYDQAGRLLSTSGQVSTEVPA